MLIFCCVGNLQTFFPQKVIEENVRTRFLVSNQVVVSALLVAPVFFPQLSEFNLSSMIREKVFGTQNSFQLQTTHKRVNDKETCQS